jgi:Xaa-Pro aminopeptidase
MLLGSEMFQDHRRRTLGALEPGSAMLLFGAHHATRSNDTEYKYRQNSDLLYTTGWTWPEVALLLRPESEQPTVFFVQPKDSEREIWTGVRPGPAGAIGAFGADEAFDFDELGARLPALLQGVHTLYYAVAEDADRDALVMGAIRKARRTARRNGLSVPDAFIHPGRILHELRLAKSPPELDLMRRAAEITVEAHQAAMALAAPGVGEHELEAVLDYTFRRRGGSGPGYTSIVGGGANACILHYVENDKPLRDGDLVLVDAGCEFGWYTADVTRTFPVNGTFSGPQRDIYELVLASQLAAIDQIRVGTPFSTLQDVAVRVLTQGMVDLGLLTGRVEELIADQAYKRYYMHNIGHWLGLDVHDCGAYHLQGESRRLETGMVLTVEPGIYVGPNDEQAPKAFRGIGVRIEDDVLVTAGDPEVLTGALAKQVDEVEALVQQR